MTTIKNPFVIGTYISPEYFCDREQEVKALCKHIENGRNVSLVSPRRMGKTGLIHHFFNNEEIKDNYNTFFIDLYSTSSLAEMVKAIATEIFKRLKPTSEKWWERFATVISSLNAGVSIDPISGLPSFNIGLGQIQQPETSLEQIFNYLETSDRPCIVAIDEFQQIALYGEKNVEAILRTHIQRCHNTRFIHAGSKQHMMAQMFASPSRPFYQSCIHMMLAPIARETYADFCQHQFEHNGKQLQREVVEAIYDKYEGYTWYMHMMMNELYAITDKGECCTEKMIGIARENIILSQSAFFKEQLSIIPLKQKMLLEAIAVEGKVSNVTSGAFIRKHNLPSASSVQSALKGLLEKEIVACENKTYYIYDFFLAHYLYI